jgi:hypothetical protein
MVARTDLNGHAFTVTFTERLVAEYGAGTAQGAPAALPPLFNSELLRNDCEGWRIQKNQCFYTIKDLKCQNPEELVESL